jgi:hypothetical protein
LRHSKGISYDSQGKVYYRIPGASNVSQQKSQKAYASMLDSYRLYEQAILKVEDSKRVRIALKKVYQKFLYDVFPEFPLLIKEADSNIEHLGVTEKTFIGGPKFQKISRVFGFKNALRLKKYLQSK